MLHHTQQGILFYCCPNAAARSPKKTWESCIISRTNLYRGLQAKASTIKDFSLTPCLSRLT